MYAADHVSAHLGIELVAAMEGTATMRLVVGESMVNGHGLCHGGMLFTLADSACAYAANSWGEDALSTGASIEFLQPAGLGEVLTATAQETARSGRRAVLDVMVTAGDGRTVATFRGVTTQLRRA
ncbi:MAG: hotdog fold thioesterase [Acidimicrobiia bacterium]|nr:hotdog fold thioesterase [Acidimicrobiia bacterium]